MQELVNNAKEIAEKVKEAVDTGNGEGNTTQELLSAAGITPSNLTGGELAQINEELDKANPKPQTQKELQELVNNEKELANKVKEAVEAGESDKNTTEGLLHEAGITPETITPEQMKQINENIDKANPKPQTKEELQNLVNGAIEEAGKVKQAVDKAPSTSKEDLKEAGVDGTDELTEQELAQINELIEKADPKPTTIGELGKLVNQGKELADRLQEVIKKAPNISKEDLTNLGAQGAAGLNSEELAELNHLIQFGKKPQTIKELEELINQAKLNVKYRHLNSNNNKGDNNNNGNENNKDNNRDKIKEVVEKSPHATKEDLKEAGIDTQGLSKEELQKYNQMVSQAGVKPQSKEELQSYVNSAILAVSASASNINNEVKISGKFKPDSTVTVIFPDGSKEEVQTDEQGNFEVVSSNAPNGLVKVYAKDSSGIKTKEINYQLWYKTVKEPKNTKIIYDKGDNKESSVITIKQDSQFETQEEKDNANLELKVKANSKMAPRSSSSECSNKPYVAYALLSKQNGEVETGFKYDDSECAKKYSNPTIYDDKPLKFAPGTKVEIIEDKEQKVIVVDTKLSKTIKFGDK